MAHVQPHWQQPSHPSIQEVRHGTEGFTTKSYSKVDLPPFAIFSELSFPPCDFAAEPTYATVQFGQQKHLNLNSDLLYINHSCEPSLTFDTGNFNVMVGPKGLKVGEELSFFYPSTEWHMSQSFTCLCEKPTCRGVISGARDMGKEKLLGLWLNGHIREMLEQYETAENSDAKTSSCISEDNATVAGTPEISDLTVLALKDALIQAEKVVTTTRHALQTYLDHEYNVAQAVSESKERGVTSRELSGEMGGDTKSIVV